MQVLKPATPNDNFPKQFCLQLVYCSLQLLPILFPHYLPGSSCNGEGAVREECPKFPAYGEEPLAIMAVESAQLLLRQSLQAIALKAANCLGLFFSPSDSPTL